MNILCQSQEVTAAEYALEKRMHDFTAISGHFIFREQLPCLICLQNLDTSITQGVLVSIDAFNSENTSLALSTI